VSLGQRRSSLPGIYVVKHLGAYNFWNPGTKLPSGVRSAVPTVPKWLCKSGTARLASDYNHLQVKTIAFSDLLNPLSLDRRALPPPAGSPVLHEVERTRFRKRRNST